MEIEASALDAYIKYMVIWLITYPTTTPQKDPTKNSKTNPKEFLTVICLEKRYSFFSQIVS